MNNSYVVAMQQHSHHHTYHDSGTTITIYVCIYVHTYNRNSRRLFYVATLRYNGTIDSLEVLGG